MLHYFFSQLWIILNEKNQKILDDKRIEKLIWNYYDGKVMTENLVIKQIAYRGVWEACFPIIVFNQMSFTVDIS